LLVEDKKVVAVNTLLALSAEHASKRTDVRTHLVYKQPAIGKLLASLGHGLRRLDLGEDPACRISDFA